MTTTIGTLVQGKFIETVDATQFTAASLTVLDAIYVTNVGVSAADLSMNIVEEGDGPVPENLAISQFTIRPGETHLCYEVLGQVLQSGAYLSAKSSAASSLNIRVSGRIVT